MAVTIGTTIAGTVPDSTGTGWQNRLVYAVNDAAWWFFLVSSSSTTTVQTYRSTDLSSWSAGASSGAFASAAIHNSQGRNVGAAYKSISSNDVIHFTAGVRVASTDSPWQHTRATIASGVITWGSWADGDAAGNGYTAATFPVSAGTCLDSTNRPIDANSLINRSVGNTQVARATNTDSGTSWTAGFSAGTQIEIPNQYTNGEAVFDIGSGNVLLLAENASASEPSSMTNVRWSKWNGTSWSTAANVFTAFTAEDPNNFGAYAVNTGDLHCIVRTSATAKTHKRFNGTDWTTVSGATIPSQQTKAGAGIALASDGTNLWMFVIDDTTSASCKIQYIKWTAASNTWDGAWTQLEAGNGTLNYVSAAYGNSTIGVVYAKTNGSNFDVLASSLSLGGGGLGGGTVDFRRTLSGAGTRAGTRQAIRVGAA